MFHSAVAMAHPHAHAHFAGETRTETPGGTRSGGPHRRAQRAPVPKRLLGPMKHPTESCPRLTRLSDKKHRHSETHTHTHTHAHTRTRTHAHTRTHTHTNTHTHTRTRTHAHTHAHTRTRTRTHAHARAHTHTHAHTRTRTRTHARADAHTRLGQHKTCPYQWLGKMGTLAMPRLWAQNWARGPRRSRPHRNPKAAEEGKRMEPQRVGGGREVSAPRALGAHGRLRATPLATNCWPKAPRGGGGGQG